MFQGSVSTEVPIHGPLTIAMNVALAPGGSNCLTLEPLPPFAIKLGTKDAKAKIRLKSN